MRQRINSEDGFALLVVMGVMVVITAAALSGFFLSQQALGESQRTSKESRAYQAASTGLDRELASFTPASYAGAGATHVGTTANGDSYKVTVTQDSSAPFGGWIMTSVGRSADTSETVVQRYFFINLWDMNIGAGQRTPLGGGAGWNGNASISGPLYIKGTMDWTNGDSTMEGGPLFVKEGQLLIGGSATVGAAKPIYGYLTGGVAGKTGNCSWVNNPPGTSVPDIELPWVDQEYLDEKLQKTKDESVDNIMGTVGLMSPDMPNAEAATTGAATYPGTPAKSGVTYYKYIGPAGGHSGISALTGRPNGSTSLAIGTSSFGRWPGNGYGAASGQYDDFAYDRNTGTLYVNGTVFIDGPLTIDNVDHYVGNGVLICNGDVVINSNLQPSGNQLAANACLGIVTPGDVDLTGEMTGAVFCNGSFQIHDTHSGFSGSVLAGQLGGDLPNCYLHTNPDLSKYLPKDMPGANGGFVFTGVWSRY